MVGGGHLLDLNVLMALWWPAHAANAEARRWFRRHSREGWATCPLTQAGFVRLASNASFSRDAMAPADALRIMKMNLEDPAHRFWPMSLELAEAVDLSGAKLEGHRQVTDLYLIGLAVKHKGRLVTFDRALGKLSKVVTVIQ